jgi:hypothetical protein
MVKRITPYSPAATVKYKIYRERCGRYVLEWENIDGSRVPRCNHSTSSITQFVKDILVERFPDGTSCVYNLDDVDEPIDPELKLELAAAGAA